MNPWPTGAISAKTRPYAVLGHPVGHSLSPAMQNAAFAALGLDAVYLAFDVPPNRLGNVLPALAELGFTGLNLTVPLKEAAFRIIPDLDPAARQLGSVNTVVFAPDGMKGYSTDGPGFLQALEESWAVSPKGMAVFLVGCGGAGRAVAMACAAAGAARISLADADESRAAALAAGLEAGGTAVRLAGSAAQAWREACREADLVVHATPVGMRPGESSVLAPELFRAGQMVYDLIYTAPETPVLRAAGSAGARTCNGLGMLLHQGALSLSLWTGREAPVSVMRRVLEAAVYGTSRKGGGA